MDDNRLDEDEDEVRAAQRVTTGEARRQAGAEVGMVEPTVSEEANEPTTAAADRVRMGNEATPSQPTPP